MRQNRSLTFTAAAAAALLGIGAFAASHRTGPVEPAPMDAILDAMVDATEAPRRLVPSIAEPVAAAVVAGEAGAPAVVDLGPSSATGAAGAAVRFAAVTSRGRADWDLTVTHNDRVQYWLDFLTGRNKDRTREWLEREGRYGGMIRERLRERGMPQDLLYLGMIESGLSPRAYSRAHASGMWQFIAETGRRYGLEVTPYVDLRRDPIAATDAALSYLSDLHGRFGSWYLAAAAYNTGENRVERVLRQRAGGRKGDDALFWRIDRHLPRETRDYVPLMLAAGHIAKDPERYGFHGLKYQAPLEYEEVTVPGGVALRNVAEAAGVEAAEVEALNPHLVRGSTPPGEGWLVRVPSGHRAAVATNLAWVVESQREADEREADAERSAPSSHRATLTHRISRGETLSHVANRYGVSVAALRGANGSLNPRRLQVGQRVVVPAGSARLAQADAAQVSWKSYRVRRGDSLWVIARRHGVSIRQLRSWNGIGTRIYPGQTLRIRA